MKILVIKTNCDLTDEAREKVRNEAQKAIKSGIMVLTLGFDVEVIEVGENA